MDLHGRVLAVTEELAGDYLAIDTTGGDAVLVCNDVSDFAEDGGQLVLDPDGEDGGPLTLDYSAADVDLDEIALAGTVTTIFPAGTAVRVKPEYKVVVAYVQPDDPAMVPVAARVPFAMRSQLPLGTRSDVYGENDLTSDPPLGVEEVVVQLVRGAWVVTDILGITPVTGEAATDSAPPSVAPVVSVYGGIGELYVLWDGIPNADEVTYEVYMSLDPTFEVGPETFVGEIKGTFFTIRNLPQPTP